MVDATLAGMQLPAESLVMVGDRDFTDQRFAEAAGMRFLGVRPRRWLRPPPPDDTWMPWPLVVERLRAFTRRQPPAG
jgi:FMN phosphatase YigB (HAD superfamily)